MVNSYSEILFSPKKKEILNSEIHATIFVAAVQSLSHVWLFVTSRTAAHLGSLSFTVSSSLHKLMSIESVMLSNQFILCHLFSSCPQSFPESGFCFVLFFSNKWTLCIRWPKYWSFSFSLNPSNESSGLISFRIDWLHLLAVQGILKSLLQHHNLKASIFPCSAFFMIQLS